MCLPPLTHTYTTILSFSLSLPLQQHTQTYTECISLEGDWEDNEVVTSTTSDVDDSNTTDAADADRVGNDVNTEEEEEYLEPYFVPDDEESIVIIKEVDDNIIKTIITIINNDTTTTTVVVVSEEEGVMAEEEEEEEEDREQQFEDKNDNDNSNDDDTNNTVVRNLSRQKFDQHKSVEFIKLVCVTITKIYSILDKVIVDY